MLLLEAEVIVGGRGGLESQKHYLELLRYLSGFAHFGSFSSGYGRFRISFLEKRFPLLLVYLSFSEFPFYLF